ncbi:unnamed protein product [Caenorhabditis brenneri]
MLRWAARNYSQGSKGAGNLWRDYVEHYCSDHTEQSLYGRIRRIILPKIQNYVESLEPTEISKIYRIYGSRLNVEQREYIKKQISVSHNCRHNREHKLQKDKSNGLHESIANKNKNSSINLDLSDVDHVGIGGNVDRIRNSSGEVPEKQRISLSCRASRPSHSEKHSLKSKKESNVFTSASRMKRTKQNDTLLNPGSENGVQEQISRNRRSKTGIFFSEREVEEITLNLSRRSASSQLATKTGFQSRPKRSFCARTWNLNKRPIAEEGARSVFDLMKSCIERENSESVCHEVLGEAMDRNNMNELFEKMFKTEEHEGKQKLVMICTEDFNVPSTLTQLRMQYFQNIGQKLETNHVNDYVHSAVLVFFLYFEFYFAKCTSCYDKNRHENQFHDLYVHLMNHLVGIIVTLMTF